MNRDTAMQDAPDAPQHPLLQEWKRLTSEGLAASRAHCLAHAMTWYVQALHVARQLLSRADDGVDDGDRLAAFIVAHLNIADCYTEMGQPDDAAECLYCAHHQLLALLRDDDTPQPLQLAACQQLHQTYAALQQHRAQFGDRTPAADALHAHAAPAPRGQPHAWLH